MVVIIQISKNYKNSRPPFGKRFWLILKIHLSQKWLTSSVCYTKTLARLPPSVSYTFKHVVLRPKIIFSKIKKFERGGVNKLADVVVQDANQMMKRVRIRTKMRPPTIKICRLRLWFWNYFQKYQFAYHISNIRLK